MRATATLGVATELTYSILVWFAVHRLHIAFRVWEKSKHGQITRHMHSSTPMQHCNSSPNYQLESPISTAAPTLNVSTLPRFPIASHESKPKAE